MSKSKLSFKRSTIDKLSVDGILSEDGNTMTYINEDDVEQTVRVSDLLNAFKDQPIKFVISLKTDEDLDVIDFDEE